MTFIWSEKKKKSAAHGEKKKIARSSVSFLIGHRDVARNELFLERAVSQHLNNPYTHCRVFIFEYNRNKKKHVRDFYLLSECGFHLQLDQIYRAA